ncbi:MAG TPA: alpha,alpha-trehalase TreA [Chitinophagaceae bacterium]|nr:alpha,alpha-trehalase TreA [Chitinophagaceae bacterium]
MEAQPIFYIESLGKLFEDVQEQKIFPDSKFFVDCIPKEAPAALLSTYLSTKDQPGFNLLDFVTAHFILPVTSISQYASGNKPILEHLEALWPVLTRHPDKTHGGTLIPLPHPYVVPGGRFREIYYWDSYFTMLGLQVSRQIDTMQHMVDNFAYLIDSFGFIPNGNRTYYLSRSQPPFFTLMVELLAEEKGNEVLLQYLPQIEKEYAFWMDGETEVAPGQQHRRVVRLPDGDLLNRYCDEKDSARPEAYREDSKAAARAINKRQAHIHIRAACESGWDFSSRWFRDGNDMGTIQTAHLVPVDLNCLLLHMEEVLAAIYQQQQNTVRATAFQQKITLRKTAITKYCWNQQQGFYFDYHFIDGQQTSECTLAAAYPLFFTAASKEQAAGVATMLEEKFLQAGGLVTTLRQSGQQWDFPNGWAPLQWIAYKGLKNYGHDALARRIRERWMAANEHVYAHTGKMMEKYNVTDTVTKAGGGEYPNQDGFGWSNGVYLKLSCE